MPFSLELPYPLSVNAMYKSIGENRRAKSKRYKDWIKEAGEMLQIQRKKYFIVRVDLDIRVCGGRKNADISNLIKGVEDILVSFGILQDDKKEYVRSVKIAWVENEPECIVTITEVE
jgi:Holliday junction resolvase RusA-like endonuclease